MHVHRLLTSALLAGLLPALTAAHAAPPALTLDAGARLRHEHVGDDAFVRAAQATTVRLRAGLHAKVGAGVEGLVEGDAVAKAGDRYNSGANGRTGYPVVLDPEGAELNQAWLRWANAEASATIGRQRMLLENQRWLGTSGWRQNEQTFDALATQWRPVPGVELRYALLDRVHRVAGDEALDPLARERDLWTHLASAAWVQGQHRVAGFALLHADQDVPAASTATRGLRYVRDPGKAPRGWGLVAEAARQTDHADNPMRFSHAYWLVEPSLVVGGLTFRAGWERLAGDGRHAVQTPLASLHGFNGWADRFLATPLRGLEDRYVGLGGRAWRGRGAGPLEWTIVYHDYTADEGGARYGREVDASAGLALTPTLKALAKVAAYRADGFSRDATKVWFQLEWAPAPLTLSP